MADQMLSDFLSGIQMTRLANSEAIKRGLPNELPPEFMQESSARPVGMEVQWDEVKGNRQLAQIVHHESPSRRRETPGVQKRTATALGAKEHFVLGQDKIMSLKSNIPSVAEGARRLLVQNMADFRSYFDNLRLSVVCSALFLGKIYYDKDGNLLPSSSGAYNTVDFNIPSANVIGVGGTILGANTLGDWATATTDIPGNLRTFRQASVLATNYVPMIGLYGKNIPGYMYSNTAVQNFMSRNQIVGKEFIDTNEIPQGLFRFQWKAAYDHYFVDKGGTTRLWVGDDEIHFFPMISPEWYELVPAGTLVPTGIGSPGMSIDQLLGLSTIANGRFSYSEMSIDPLFVKIITGDYFLPIIKVPGVKYKFTVH